MRLCSLAGGVKIAADGELGLMREKRGAQARQLLVGLQASEAFCGFDHGGARPSQSHGGVAPPLHISVLFGRLILGGELAEPGQALGRLGGIALLGLALTSWPDPAARAVTRAMLAYNLLATVYLGIIGKLVGVLLWSAVVLHLLFTALLAAECITARRA